MAIQDTDNLIIGRGSDTYKAPISSLKTELNSEYVKLDGGSSQQTITGTGGLKLEGNIELPGGGGSSEALTKSEIEALISGSAGQDLGYTPNGNSFGTVTITNGTDAQIPVVTDTVSGLMTGTQRQALSDLSSNALTSVNLGYSANGNSAGTVTNTGGNNATIPVVTTSQAGLMTGTDKSKLDGLSGGSLTATQPIEIKNNDIQLNRNRGLTLNGNNLETDIGDGLTYNGNRMEANLGNYLRFDNGKITFTEGSILVLDPIAKRVTQGGHSNWKTNSPQSGTNAPDRFTLSFALPSQANGFILLTTFRTIHYPTPDGGQYPTDGSSAVSRIAVTNYMNVQGRSCSNQTGDGNKIGVIMGGTFAHIPQGDGSGNQQWSQQYWATRIDEFHCNTGGGDISVEFSMENINCNKCQIYYLSGNRGLVIPFVR